jgi:hypothetical protein
MSDVRMATMTVIGVFAPLFSKRVFAYVKLLLAGASLAPGQRPMHRDGSAARAGEKRRCPLPARPPYAQPGPMVVA